MMVGIRVGRLASHPGQGSGWSGWEQEFDAAYHLGCDAVEWAVDAQRSDQHPLRHAEGRAAIRQRSTEAQVRVMAVRLDEAGFRNTAEGHRARGVEWLLRAIGEARAVGAKIVVLPMPEEQMPRGAEARVAFAAYVHEPLALVRSLEMQCGFELSGPAQDTLGLLEAIGHPHAKAYYAIGQALDRGGDLVDELRMLAPQLVGVRLEDRGADGRRCLIGRGVVDYPAILNALGERPFAGMLMLDIPEGTHQPQEIAASVRFVREHLKSLPATQRPAGALAR